MGIKQKHNNPRWESAVRQVASDLHKRYGGWWWFTSWKCKPYWFWRAIFAIACAADKYDVLNRLATGSNSLARSFIRADIRRKKPPKPKAIGILVIILLIIITF